jgi:hypothetical protein
MFDVDGRNVADNIKRIIYHCQTRDTFAAHKLKSIGQGLIAAGGTLTLSRTLALEYLLDSDDLL